MEVEPDDATDRPIAIAHDGYVSSNACIECHQDEHASWHQSYHRTMTQVVSEETVAGLFDGQTRKIYDWEFRPERRDDEFWMAFRSTKTGMQFDHKLVLSTGSHHMQKYWYHTGQSRKLGLAPLIYLAESKRWVPEHTAFLRPTQPDLPVREGTWNKGCNQCHATGSQPRISGPDEMDTLVAEFGISCEACHGPGEKHVAAKTAESIVNPRNLTPTLSAQVCGQCHGAWLTKKGSAEDYDQIGNTYRPGDDLSEVRYYPHEAQDAEMHSRMHATSSFWPDGQVRVAGREYNGLLASPCYQNGSGAKKMSCISCHDMHNSGDLDTKQWANDQLHGQTAGNEACLQCHESFREDLAAHTHHAADSAGSLCYNCHMPYTTYGLMKAVRAHTITSPSVRNSVETGRPNACNQCHLDRTLDWTDQRLSEWFNQPRTQIPAVYQNVAASIVWAVKGDAAQRALMAWSMGWESSQQASDSHWMVFFLTNLLFDDYDAIRYIALRSLRSMAGYEPLQYDHLRPKEERNRVMDEVMSTWQSSTNPLPTSPHLLFTPQGGLRFDLFQQLMQQQDKRPIVITE